MEYEEDVQRPPMVDADEMCVEVGGGVRWPDAVIDAGLAALPKGDLAPLGVRRNDLRKALGVMLGMLNRAGSMDGSQVEDIQRDGLEFVPEGVYACRVVEVRPGWTQAGDARWAFKLEVCAGEYVGRTAAWDGLTWGERGMRRTKFVLGKLGFDVSGKIAIEPNDLIGCTCYVEVRHEERIDPATGVRSIRMRVPFLGYAVNPSNMG